MRTHVFIYHDVLPLQKMDLLSSRERYYTLAAEVFEEQLSFLSEEGFSTVLPGQSPSTNCPTVMLTFDDGLHSAFQCHLQLKHYGFQGVFFVVTDFIGKSSYLTWEQLRSMQASGMSVQSHTCSHPVLTALEPHQVEWEFTRSRAILEDRLGQPVDSLSIPQGFADRRVVDIARESGYRYIFTSRPGRYRPGSHAPIPRLSIYSHTSLSSFRRMAYGHWLEIGRQKARKSLLGIPKRILGDHAYHRLRKMLLQKIDQLRENKL